jgi:tetratricopeptide (TPR) repeat protein
MWQQPKLENGRLSGYALGWNVRRHAGERRSAGHEGGGLTTFRRYIDDRLTVILLTNGTRYRFDPDELADALAAVFVPGLRSDEAGLLDRMRSAWSASGEDIASSLAVYRSFVTSAEHASADTEAVLNRFGYDLLERSRPAAAVHVFRLNTERYPDSSNAHDSLGEGLAAAGEIREAMHHYRESLRLDPSNGNAEEMLRSLAERLARSGAVDGGT